MSRISCSSICLRQLLRSVQWLPSQWTHRSPTFAHLSVGCPSPHLPYVHSVAWQNFLEWEHSWHFLHSIGLSLYGYTLVIICSPRMSIVCGILSLLKVITQAVWCLFLGLIHFASTISDTWYFIIMPCLKEGVFYILKSFMYTSPLLLLNLLRFCTVQVSPISVFISSIFLLASLLLLRIVYPFLLPEICVAAMLSSVCRLFSTLNGPG